jgi:hypothetical protein
MYSYSKLCNLIEESKFNVSFSWLNLQHLRVQVVRDFVYKEKFLGVCLVHRNLKILSLFCSNINSIIEANDDLKSTKITNKLGQKNWNLRKKKSLLLPLIEFLAHMI